MADTSRDALNHLERLVATRSMPSDSLDFTEQLVDILKAAEVLSSRRKAGATFPAPVLRLIESGFQILVNAWLDLRTDFRKNDVTRDSSLPEHLMDACISECVFVAAMHLVFALGPQPPAHFANCLAEFRLSPFAPFIEENILGRPLFPDGRITLDSWGFFCDVMETRYYLFDHGHLYTLYRFLFQSIGAIMYFMCTIDDGHTAHDDFISKAELALASLMRPGRLLSLYAAKTSIVLHTTSEGDRIFDSEVYSVFLAGTRAYVASSEVGKRPCAPRSRHYLELCGNTIGPFAREYEARIGGCEPGVIADAMIAYKPRYMKALLDQQEKDLTEVMADLQELFHRQNLVILVVLQRLSLAMQDTQTYDLRLGYRILYSALEKRSTMNQLHLTDPLLVQIGNSYVVAHESKIYVFRDVMDVLAAWLTLFVSPKGPWVTKRDLLIAVFRRFAIDGGVPVVVQHPPDPFIF